MAVRAPSGTAPAAQAPSAPPIKPPQLTVTIDGLDAITKYFLRAPSKIAGEIYGPGIRRIGIQLRGNIRRFTPVLTRALWRGMTLDIDSGKVPRYVTVYNTKAYAWKIDTGRDRQGRIARKAGGAHMFRRGVDRTMHFMARTLADMVRKIERKASGEMKKKGKVWTSKSS